MVSGAMPDLSKVLPALQSAAESHKDDVAAALSATAPKRTGAFASGIEADAAASGDGATITVTADDPLATWILDGTKAHEIRPVNARYLRFEVSGSTVFAKHVDHPGTAANDFVAAADDAIDAVIESILDDTMAAV